MASALVAVLAAPVAAQDIELSNIAAGTGGFVINGQAAGDLSAEHVSSAGDVNGDGLADLLVGARWANPVGRPSAGRSYVIFGKVDGTEVRLSTVDSSVAGFVINGQASWDQSGVSVSSAGDVNGDGLADVIIGADGGDPAAGADAGRSYLVFGKTNSAGVDLSTIDAGMGGFVINGQTAGDMSGISVSSAGDINGDGLTDMIVGARVSGPSAGTSEGRSYVVFGKPDGADVELSAIANGTGGYNINGQAINEGSGRAVSSAGDVNGDGLADVIVGAYRSDPDSGIDAGRSYVVFGKTDTTTVELSVIAAGTGMGFVLNGQAAGDAAGSSVSSAGDVNGDGLADLIVGAPLSDPSAGLNAGRSYVVFGKTDSAAVELSAVASGTSPFGFMINGQAENDWSGRVVASAGDVNGDGLGDLLVAAHFSDPPTGIEAGRSYIVLGKPTTETIELSAVDGGIGGFVLNGPAAFDRSGMSVSSAGDVNGDGLADIFIGALRNHPAAIGRSYVIFSPYTPATTGAYRGQVAAGNPNRQGLGVHRFGDDATIFPDSRAWVDFDAGAGPGLASSSEVVATITRNDTGLKGFDPLNTANVQWQFTTNRTGWSACRVTVRYTDAEIAGLAEGDLVLYTAPTAAGPFVPAANFTLTPTRNEAAGEVASMPAVFVLSTVPPGVFILDGDANDDGSVDIADVTAIHNDLAGIASLTPDGVANLANIGGVSVAAANAVLDHLANGAPLP